MQENVLTKAIFSQTFWLLCKFQKLAENFLQVCQKSIQHAQRLNLTKLFPIGTVGKPTISCCSSIFLAKTFRFSARTFQHGCQSCILPKEKNILNAQFFRWNILYRNNFDFSANTFQLVCQKCFFRLQVCGKRYHHCI